MAQSMMNLTTLPMSFWGYALEFAAHILSMFLTKKVDKTPYELWHGKAPNLSYLKVWGCEALLKRDMLEKVKSRFVKCIFDSLTLQEASSSNLDLEVIQDEDTQPSKNTNEHHDEVEHENVKSSSDVVPICRSARISQALDRYGIYVDVEEHGLRDLNEPPNYKAAFSNLEYDKWVEAINVEMQSKKDNKV
ncbi:retrotransposon protein, putative, ty1-copia subclass [Tanacetum coccineum]